MQSHPSSDVVMLQRHLHDIHNHYGLLLALAYRHLADLAEAGVSTALLDPLMAELDAAVIAYHAARGQTVAAASHQSPTTEPAP